MSIRSLGRPVALAALALLFAGTLSVGAAPGRGPVSQVVGALGLGATPGDTHGTAVSGAVADAIASSTPGAELGSAVSLAACIAAHDRSTLPAGAQAAPGQLEKEAKVCETETLSPGELSPVEATATPAAELAAVVLTATPTHGQVVSEAVHAAQASATPGAGRGVAVSEAACTAAHDRTTLPEGAQNAPGRVQAEVKDCTHPNSTATAAGSEEESDPTEATGSGNRSGRGNAGGKGQGGGNTTTP